MIRLLSTILVIAFIATNANADECVQVAGCRFENPWNPLLREYRNQTSTLVLKKDGTFIHFFETSYPTYFESSASTSEIGTWFCSVGNMTFVIDGKEYFATLSTPAKLGEEWTPEIYLKDKSTPVIQFRAHEKLDRNIENYWSLFSRYYEMKHENIDGKKVCN
ncbi:MAG: hypothetical protein K8963_06260 [Proteobacteria bacterium]|nr:hypothetical protein [Pseudomonadota bacterium]